MKLRLSALTGHETMAIRDALGDLPYPLSGEAVRLIEKCNVWLREPEEAAFHPPQCQWFALCDHMATGTMRHGILGEVPICDRCRDRINEIQGRQTPIRFTPYPKEPT